MIRPGHGIALATLSLLLLGVLMVNSVWLARSVGDSAATLADSPAADPITAASLLWGRPTLYAGLAVIAFVLGSLVPMRRIDGSARPDGLPPAWPALVAASASLLLLAMVYVPGLGREVNGARRWIEIGPLTLQPSELAKWSMPLLLAWWCVRCSDRLGEFRRGFLPAMTGILVIGGLIGLEDLGTAVLMVGVATVVLLAAGMRWLHLLSMVPVGALALAAAIVESPYRLRRLLAWQDPFADPQGIGYHIIQSLSAISGGGLAGRGLGQGVQKFGYLPEGTTDFIFAIVCEELGLAGAVLVAGLFAAVLWCGLGVIAPRDCSRNPNRFGRILGLGILLTIGIQALMNLLVVTGLAPTKGIALPLVSHGGSGWLLTAFSLGLLLAIERSAASEPVDLCPDLADPTEVPVEAAVAT